MTNATEAPFTCIHNSCDESFRCDFRAKKQDGANVIPSKAVVDERTVPAQHICTAKDDPVQQFDCDQYSEGTIFEM